MLSERILALDALAEKILVTAALPYANGPLHLGHLAGAYIPADVYVRYQRLKGADVLFICGSDEHGVPITIRADREKVSPKEIVDRYHQYDEKEFSAHGRGISTIIRGLPCPCTTRFRRTSFSTCITRAIISEQSVQQYYCPTCNRFLPDRYIEGECPHCHKHDARGRSVRILRTLAGTRAADRAEMQNLRLRAGTAEQRSTGTFGCRSFKRSSRSGRSSKSDWKSNVREFCSGWFQEGLTDRPITRDIDWGIPVPLPDAEGKVLYVWFDAPDRIHFIFRRMGAKAGNARTLA